MLQTKPIKKPLKPCAEMGCVSLTRERYCETHKKTAQKNTRAYNENIRDKKTNSFYNSRAWRRLRTLAIERDNHLCQRCIKKGILKRANVVHHIVEVKDDWNRRLDLSNLESLCHGCHNAEHKSTPGV